MDFLYSEDAYNRVCAVKDCRHLVLPVPYSVTPWLPGPDTSGVTVLLKRSVPQFPYPKWRSEEHSPHMWSLGLLNKFIYINDFEKNGSAK